MASEQMVDDLIAITGRLVALMTTEIEHLRAHRTHEVEALQSDKAALARAYETIVRELRKRPGLLATLAPAIKAELAGKAHEFQRLLVANEAALRAAKEVNGRVLKAIADAVVASQKDKGGYTNLAAAGNRRGPMAKTAVPVSINRTL
jgi:ribosomal protein L17